MGAMSFVKVGFDAVLSAAPARAGVAAPIAAATARRHSRLHVLLIPELLASNGTTSELIRPENLPPSAWIRARLTRSECRRRGRQVWLQNRPWLQSVRAPQRGSDPPMDHS